MKKYFFAVALSLLPFAAVTAPKANAQSCPATGVFGGRRIRPVDHTLRSHVEVVYFTTNDPGAFISEAAGIDGSASYANLGAGQFAARIEGLERRGEAKVRKRQTATLYLGETAGLNLERERGEAEVIDTSLVPPDARYVFGLDRETEVSVFKGPRRDGDYYRVGMLSWFVKVNASGALKTVDYDAEVLLKPGQTAVFKLMGDDEVRRSGAARSHIAITLRSVNAVNAAALESDRVFMALR